jgi:DNA-binding NarL/FixJ family response regulator
VLPMTVVIADDHAAVRKSLRLLMEWEPGLKLIGEAADGLEAIRAVHALKPDLLLLDIKMCRMTGLEVLQYLRNEMNPVAIIIVSNHSEPYYVEAAMRLGANAFVAKESGLEVLMTAVHTVREGLTGTTCSETPS